MIRLFEVTIGACLVAFVVGQVGVTDCALPCIANVNGTSCAQTEWPCLCPSSVYIDHLNACVYQACTNAESQQATLGAIANICQVFGFPLTASAEVNAASTLDLSGTVSVLGVPTVSTLPAASGASASGLTMLTSTNTPTTPSNNTATSTSSTDLVSSGSAGTRLSTSSTGEVTDNMDTPSPSATSSSVAVATFTGAASSLVSLGKYAAWGGALAGGMMFRYI